ncbi:MAG: hypothetical protein SGJ20_21265 [Planctomycetota bacterium]|nr:hypothetical protein [Planctomycetota bacterium]
MPSTIRKNRRPSEQVRSREQITLKAGERVELVSGTLAGITGEVIRLEKPGIYLIGVPATDSGLLIRVPIQRFRPLARLHG